MPKESDSQGYPISISNPQNWSLKWLTWWIGGLSALSGQLFSTFQCGGDSIENIC